MGPARKEAKHQGYRWQKNMYGFFHKNYNAACQILIGLNRCVAPLTSFCKKNHQANRFVTMCAPRIQVQWPVSLFCKFSDLSTHTLQILWPPVLFTLLKIELDIAFCVDTFSYKNFFIRLCMQKLWPLYRDIKFFCKKYQGPLCKTIQDGLPSPACLSQPGLPNTPKKSHLSLARVSLYEVR
jgi:hypothetical protein